MLPQEIYSTPGVQEGVHFQIHMGIRKGLEHACRRLSCLLLNSECTVPPMKMEATISPSNRVPVYKDTLFGCHVVARSLGCYLLLGLGFRKFRAYCGVVMGWVCNGTNVWLNGIILVSTG